MGLDAVIGFVSPTALTQEQMDQMTAWLRDRMGFTDEEHYGSYFNVVPVRTYYFVPPENWFGYEVSVPWRYYGSYYERGPWHHMRNLFDLIRFKRGNVFYTNDCCTDEPSRMLFTPERQAELDNLWYTGGPGGRVGP